MSSWSGADSQLFGGICTVLFLIPAGTYLILITLGTLFTNLGIKLQDPPIAASRTFIPKRSFCLPISSSRQVLFWSLYANIVFTTIGGLSIAIRKLDNSIVSADACVFLAKLDKSAYTAAKVASLFFFGVRAIVVRDDKSDRRKVYAMLALIIGGFLGFCILWVNRVTGVIIPIYGCVTTGNSEAALIDGYLFNPVDLLAHTALLVLFVLPLRRMLVTSSNWNNNSQSAKTYKQLLGETAKLSGISIGVTQTILCIEMLNYFLKDIVLALITSSLYVADLVITCTCQLYAIRKSWELRIGSRSWFGFREEDGGSGVEKNLPLLSDRDSMLRRKTTRTGTLRGTMKDSRHPSIVENSSSRPIIHVSSTPSLQAFAAGAPSASSDKYHATAGLISSTGEMKVSSASSGAVLPQTSTVSADALKFSDDNPLGTTSNSTIPANTSERTGQSSTEQLLLNSSGDNLQTNT